jgi:hypothetical protein
MAGKLGTIASDYGTAMGNTAGFQIVTDKNATVLKNLGFDPGEIDPTYNTSPKVQVSNFYNASPANAQAIDAIMQAAPNATPQDVIDQLSAAGINVN